MENVGNCYISNIFLGILSSGKKSVTKIQVEKKPKGKYDKYLGAKFRFQIKNLMNELNSSDCHFVRCLKPNEMKKKMFFVPKLTLQQIRYLGVLDSIRIRKESYPIRKVYKNFINTYFELHPLSAKTSLIDLKKSDANLNYKAMTEEYIIISETFFFF